MTTNDELKEECSCSKSVPCGAPCRCCQNCGKECMKEKESPMKKENDELIEEFKKKREDLKDWLYGTVYKGYDQEELAGVVQEDVDRYFTDEWFKEVLTQKDAEVARERERIVGIIDKIQDVEPESNGRYNACMELKSLITNKGDTNN